MPHDPIIASWLKIANSCQLCAVVVDENGKRCFPLDPLFEIDAERLYREHEAGEIGPVRCIRSTGETWIEERATATAARCADDEDMCAIIAADLDAEGRGHAPGQCVPADVAAKTARITTVKLAEAGLPAWLARSPGGLGRHVLSVLPAGVPFEVGHWIISTLRDAVLRDIPEAKPGFEIRPNSARPPGSPITLPTMERTEFIHQPENPIVGLDRLLCAWDKAQSAKRSQMANKQPVRPSQHHYEGDVQSADVDLIAVAETCGEVVRRQGAEVHVRCPCCHGTVKIHPSKRMWCCFRCGTPGGAGDAASFTLARHLMPDASDAQVFNALRAAAGRAVA